MPRPTTTARRGLSVDAAVPGAAAMNAKLNALLAREIGTDDGSFLPLKSWIDWKGARPEMINL